MINFLYRIHYYCHCWDFRKDSIDYRYLEGSCGLHYLTYSNGLIKGQITEQDTVMPLDSFKVNILDCIDYISSTSSLELEMKSSFIIFPNPVSNILKIENKKLCEVTNVLIFDSHGKVLISKKFNERLRRIALQIDNLDDGVYFCTNRNT